MIFPPTPAYAKARAAPGNTGGVECWLLPRPTISVAAPTSHCGHSHLFYRCSELLFARAGHSHLLLPVFKTAIGQTSKPPNRRRQLPQGTRATAICLYQRSTPPFAKLQNPKTLHGSCHKPLGPKLYGPKAVLRNLSVTWSFQRWAKAGTKVALSLEEGQSWDKGFLYRKRCRPGAADPQLDANPIVVVNSH